MNTLQARGGIAFNSCSGCRAHTNGNYLASASWATRGTLKATFYCTLGYRRRRQDCIFVLTFLRPERGEPEVQAMVQSYYAVAMSSFVVRILPLHTQEFWMRALEVDRVRPEKTLYPLRARYVAGPEASSAPDVAISQQLAVSTEPP